MQDEIWKEIENYEDLYEISTLGRVRTKERFSIRKDKPKFIIPSKFLRGSKHKLGYFKIILSKNNETKTFLIHRLVATHFIENPNNYTQVNHKDGNKLNNNVSNLEWCTPSENIIHAEKLGLRTNAKGEANANNKLSREDVLDIFCNKELKNWELAIKYNISRPTVTDIKKKKIWSWLTKDL